MYLTKPPPTHTRTNSPTYAQVRARKDKMCRSVVHINLENYFVHKLAQTYVRIKKNISFAHIKIEVYNYSTNNVINANFSYSASKIC